MFSKSIQLSQRALEFYRDAFLPQYEVLKRAANETPLVVLMWGPSTEWYRQRLEIRDALVERGHQVVFREDLGIPSGLVPARAMDLIHGQTADVAIVIQSTYSAIGEVQHFAEFRVVESRMLLFVDESAKDRRSYLPSVAQLQLLYNNVETFKSPEQMVKGDVLKMVLDKIAIIQLVKYLAQQSARRWGVNLHNYPVGARGEDLKVFPINLLELYRAHRSETDLLNDPTSLFLLALFHQTQGSSHKVLARDSGLQGAGLQRKLMPLLTSRMLVDDNGMLQPTDLGKQVLSELGLPVPARPVERTVPRVSSPLRAFPAQSFVVTVVTAFALLCIISLFLWFNVVQSNLPLSFTATRVNATAQTTTLPAPSVTPTIRR